jgi:DNA-binding MarR family transcriptional regulator
LFDTGLKPAGIRSTQFVLLVAIAALTPVSIGQLARILAIDRTTLTRSLRLMEKQDFVAIARRSTMRRRFVTLLPEGKDVLARSLPFWKEAQSRFVEKVGEQYWRAMQKELEKLPGVALELARGAKGPSSML